MTHIVHAFMQRDEEEVAAENHVKDSAAGIYANHMESYQKMEQILKMYVCVHVCVCVCACVCVYVVCVRVRNS